MVKKMDSFARTNLFNFSFFFKSIVHLIYYSDSNCKDKLINKEYK